MKNIYVLESIYIDIVPYKYFRESENAQFKNWFVEEQEAKDNQVYANISALYEYIQLQGIEEEFNDYLGFIFKIMNGKPMTKSAGGNYFVPSLNLIQLKLYKFIGKNWSNLHYFKKDKK